MSDANVILLLSFIGSLICVMTPILKLNSSITKLNTTIDVINKSIGVITQIKLPIKLSNSSIQFSN